MTLHTLADLPHRSPILPDLGEPDQAHQAGVTLADATGIGMQHWRGAETALRAANGDLPGEIGEVLPVEGGLAARLTDDELMLLTPDRAEPPDPASSSSLVTVTDVSHGYGVLLLAGPSASLVMSKLCALDFSESGFGDLHAAHTSLANVRAVVLRRDHDDRRAYVIAAGRSVTDYVWGMLLDAAGEYMPIVVDGESMKRGFFKGGRK